MGQYNIYGCVRTMSHGQVKRSYRLSRITAPISFAFLSRLLTEIVERSYDYEGNSSEAQPELTTVPRSNFSSNVMSLINSRLFLKQTHKVGLTTQNLPPETTTIYIPPLPVT